MNTRPMLPALLALALLMMPGFAQEGPGTADSAPALETEIDRISYWFGTQLASKAKAIPFDLNVKALVRAIEDVLAGHEPALNETEMAATQTAFQTKMQEDQAAAAAKGGAEGEAFLAANKDKDGVEVTGSGLQYKVLTAGSGPKPGATDQVKVHYRGTLIDGTEFDSSYKRNEPATFPVNRVIGGWTEALQLMGVGSTWQLFIPANLAYGDRSDPGSPIPPNSVLIFDVELLEIL